MLFSLWLFSFLLFWAGYYLLTRGSLTRHLGFLHYLIYFFAIYFGSYFLYEDRGSLNDRYLVSVILHPMLSLAGMVCASLWAGKSHLADDPKFYPRNERILVLAWLAFFLAVYGIYLASLGNEIPLVSLFVNRDARLANVTRYLSTKGYTGEGAGGLQSLLWISRILIDYFSTFLLVFVFYYSVVRRRRWAPFWLALAFFTFMALLNNEKYPAVRLFVIAGLCYFNLKHPKITAQSLLHGVVAFFFGIMLIGAIYGTVSGSYLLGKYDSKLAITFKYGWDMFSSRTLLGQTSPLYVIYDIIPMELDYFHGITLENPKELLPYKRVELPYVTCEYIYDYDPLNVCSAPTAFFGEVYANFGLGISFLSMFLFGFSVQWLNSKLVGDATRTSTPFHSAFFYMLMMFIGDFAISFNTLYFDPRVWFFVLLYALRKRLDGTGETALHDRPGYYR